MPGLAPVRRLAPGDADAFAGLVRGAFAALGLRPPPSALGLTGDAVRAHLAAGGGGFVTDAAQAGLLWGEDDGGLHVSRLAVHPAHRGQGLAARLLDAAEAEAVRRQLPYLWLATRVALTANRGLFARFGFIEGTPHSHPGHAEPTYIDMVKLVGWNRR